MNRNSIEESKDKETKDWKDWTMIKEWKQWSIWKDDTIHVKNKEMIMDALHTYYGYELYENDGFVECNTNRKQTYMTTTRTKYIYSWIVNYYAQYKNDIDIKYVNQLVSHDGYDEYGPESDIYDLLIWYVEKGADDCGNDNGEKVYKMDIWHREDWFFDRSEPFMLDDDECCGRSYFFPYDKWLKLYDISKKNNMFELFRYIQE